MRIQIYINGNQSFSKLVYLLLGLSQIVLVAMKVLVCWLCTTNLNAINDGSIPGTVWLKLQN